MVINKLENITFKIKDDQGNKLLGSIVLDFDERRIDFLVAEYKASLDSEYGVMWTGDRIKSNCPRAIYMHHVVHSKHCHEGDHTFMTITERKNCLQDTINTIEKYIKEILTDLGFNYNDDPLLIKYPNFERLKSIKELMEETDFYVQIFTRAKPNPEWRTDEKKNK